MPLPKTNLDELEETQKTIIKILSQHNSPLEIANTLLHEKLQKSKQIISYHLSELEKKGLISSKYIGRSKSYMLTQAG